MKLINVIGYSGSGKTHLIAYAIKKLKSDLDLAITVIKNVHTHKIDIEGKSYLLHRQVESEKGDCLYSRSSKRHKIQKTATREMRMIQRPR